MRAASSFVLLTFLALTGCRQALLGTRAARVLVHYPRFRPGCLHLLVSDDAQHSMEATVTPPPEGDTTVVAVYRPSADWSDTLTIAVTAHERTCDAAPLGAAQVVTHPLEFKNPTAFDFSFDLPDGDGDGYVDQAVGGTDCRDDLAAVHPDAQELCNDRDDDCDGQTDEGFDAGATCEGACVAGTIVCAPDGTQVCNAPQVPPPWYRDEDSDGDGNPDAVTQSCAPPDAGYVADAGDCNDGDPFTARTRVELCDGRDNDCDGEVDEGGVCPGDAGAWTSKLIGDSANEDYLTVTTWDGGGVWVAGKNDSLRYKLPDSGTFVKAFPCRGTDWYGSWADPNGRVSLGGVSRGTYRDPLPNGSCPDLGTESDTITSLTGFRAGSTQSVYWTTDGGQIGSIVGASLRFASIPNLDFHDIHGLSPTLMFAVGDNGDAGRIYRGLAPDGGWTAEGVDLPGVTLNAVYIVNPRLAFAVGPNGTVLEWNGSTWSRRAYDNDTGLLRAVLAFGRNNVYVVDSSSVRRSTQDGGWETAFTLTGPGGAGVPLWDLAGESPADIWSAGNDGYVVHWPN